jgi:hypothetical protein
MEKGLLQGSSISKTSSINATYPSNFQNFKKLKQAYYFSNQKKGMKFED